MNDLEIIYDLLIVGAGPAGLTAALYASRGGLSVLLVEKAYPGGQLWLSDSIENYPGFAKGVQSNLLASEMEAQARHFGAEFLTAEATAIKKNNSVIELETDGGSLKGRSLIIASGARQRQQGAEGERELTGKGVSYCAGCDGPLFRDKRVAVIGGGNTACEEAVFLTAFASEVFLIHRRDRLRAVKALRERVKSESKIKLMLDKRVSKIKGSEKVEQIVFDDSSSLDVEGVFIFVGLDPNTDFAKGFTPDEKGFIITNPDMATEVAGVFAAGDCRYGSLRQVVTACSEGAIAAENARHYIENKKGTAYDR